MGAYFEPVILYIVLFFLPFAEGAVSQAAGVSTGGFSGTAFIVRTVFYCVPSIALIWYLMSRTWKIEYWIIKPGRKDIYGGLIALACLMITGSVVGILSSLADSAGMTFQTPSNAAGWIAVIIFLIFSAYLEEIYFRFYLLTKKEEMNLSPTAAIALSTVMFSVCHIYEGPWGTLNAAICGMFLGFIFLRYGSLHGIAIAHSLYNITALVIYAIINKS
ncbi:MAG: CPBP family intramembrane metalloprotease [Treponema sp.]|nr:CPBP family intramembrane metalloprotease [Treponema sp.]